MYTKKGMKIPYNKHNLSLLEDVRKYAEKVKGTRAECLPYSEFCRFEKDGNRTGYESEYVIHRKRLNAFAVMALAEDNSEWITALEDAIWAICDEFAWALPAHIHGGVQNSEPEDIIANIDLFSAGTAFSLSEIYHLLGDKLSPCVCSRLKYEINRRIIDPYVEKRRKWGANNWSAVCVAGVTAAVIYMGTREIFDNVIQDISGSLNTFLSSYYDDGCCLEGVLYHSYGFGHFCYAAQLIREYTNGEINLFDNEKVRKMAEFSQKVYLDGKICIPFSDSTHDFSYNIGLSHFLAKEYDTVSVLPEKYEIRFGEELRFRFPELIRNFYWYDETLSDDDVKSEYIYFNDAQWYMNKRKKYAFAAKGGHNAEPHNHNDVGGFVLLKDRKFIIDDLGWPEYYNGYFGENRYNDVCASSRGHSVPFADAKLQKSGVEHRADFILQSDKEFAVDIAKAYGDDSIERLVRRFLLDDTEICITDSVSGKVEYFTERLITRCVPEIKGDKVYIEGSVISCDKECTIKIETETFEPRLSCNKMNMKPVETAYLISFGIKPEKEDFEVTIRIEI